MRPRHRARGAAVVDVALAAVDEHLVNSVGAAHCLDISDPKTARGNEPGYRLCARAIASASCNRWIRVPRKHDNPATASVQVVPELVADTTVMHGPERQAQ
ncbi:hypothetical protein [Streptomyces sp. NPDC059209]|uniref:hypothetical protein n=1 Tax=Streptomyces sp. NPDC059209 TaxID=3346769 RepID=UPI00369DB411